MGRNRTEKFFDVASGVFFICMGLAIVGLIVAMIIALLVDVGVIAVGGTVTP